MLPGRCRRRSRGATADPSGCASLQMRHVEAEVLDLVEPADVHLVEVLVRFQPRNRLIVSPLVEVGQQSACRGAPPPSR